MTHKPESQLPLQVLAGHRKRFKIETFAPETENCAAPAPWDLQGSALLFLTRRGLRMLVHYTQSPVGAYDENALLQAKRFGETFAPAIVEMQVTSQHSLRCGRENWGFPKTLAALQWTRQQRRVAFSHQRQILRFRLSRGKLPFWLPAYTVQVLAGRAVKVPMTLRGQLRLAWRGPQCCLMLENFRFHVAPPHPVDGF